MNVEKEEKNHASLFSFTVFTIQPQRQHKRYTISLYIVIRKTKPCVIKVERFSGNINSTPCYSEETAFDSNKLAVYSLRWAHTHISLYEASTESTSSLKKIGLAQ